MMIVFAITAIAAVVMPIKCHGAVLIGGGGRIILIIFDH